MLVLDIFDLPRKIKGMPLVKAFQLGARAGDVVGTYFGEQTLAQREREGASTGPVFTQEIFDYEISAIRMGAQI